MIVVGECKWGHPIVLDYPGDAPRCCVCTGRPWWRWRQSITQQHRLRDAA